MPVQQAVPAPRQLQLYVASDNIFPPPDSAVSANPLLLAAIPSGDNRPVYASEEEEAQAKSDARRTGLIIVLVSALPSVYAQDQLVWKKERQGIQVYGSKDKKTKAAKAAKKAKKTVKRR